MFLFFNSFVKTHIPLTICEPIINIVLKLSELSGAPNAFRERGQGTFPLTT